MGTAVSCSCQHTTVDANEYQELVEGRQRRKERKSSVLARKDALAELEKAAQDLDYKAIVQETRQIMKAKNLNQDAAIEVTLPKHVSQIEVFVNHARWQNATEVNALLEGVGNKIKGMLDTPAPVHFSARPLEPDAEQKGSPAPSPRAPERVGTSFTRQHRRTRCATVMVPTKWMVPVFLLVACSLSAALILESTTKRILTQASASTMESKAISGTQQLDPVTGLLLGKSLPDVLKLLSPATLPALFTLMTVFSEDLLLWSKVMLSNSVLVLVHAAVVWLTAVPTVATVQDCLGMSVGHAHSNFWELIGRNALRTTHFCLGPQSLSSEMLVDIVFALGFYELFTLRTWAWRRRARGLLLVVIGFGTSAHVLASAVNLMANHRETGFSMVCSVLFASLIYTSTAVAIVAKWWFSMMQEGPDVFFGPFDGLDDKFVNARIASFRLNGDIFVPPCCIPFCICAGREALLSDTDVESMLVEGGRLEAIHNQLRAERVT